MAVRFRKKILWVGNDGADDCKMVAEETENRFLFSKHIQFIEIDGCTVPQGNCNRNAMLLLKLFNKENIVYYLFRNQILFVLIDQGRRRTAPKFQKIKKTHLFYAILDITMATMIHYNATMETCKLLRLFKRNSGRRHWMNWHSWYPFVMKIMHRTFESMIGSPPSAHAAFLLDRASKRSSRLSTGREEDDETVASLLSSSPPQDFYACEITLEDSHDMVVGIGFRVRPSQRVRGREDNSGSIVEYVSPMIMSRMERSFKDVNRQEIDRWIPLYRNEESWSREGFSLFVGNLMHNVQILKDILNWLSSQSAEKYKMIYRDLMKLKYIFL